MTSFSAPFKKVREKIAGHWKFLVIILAMILVVITAVGFALRRFPTLRFYGAIVVTSALLILLLWLFPKWQVRPVAGLEPKDRFDRENEARKTLSQILGGLVLLIGFYFTWQNLVLTRQGQTDAQKVAQENLRIAQEGQITDRFTKAIAQLGDTKLEVRLGGIYALERIAKDSPKDHWPIMEVLTAYVREHAKRTTPEKPLLRTQGEPPTPAPDIQAILTVIGRRTLTYKNGEEQGLDLHLTDLRETDLFKANLSGAILWGAKLSGAKLRDADLSEANLDLTDFAGLNTDGVGANLSGAHLHRANLREVALGGANLFRAQLYGADLSGAHLTGANLQRASLFRPPFGAANLSGANLEDADLTHASIIGVDFSGADLKGANLAEADLHHARLFNADLTGAKGLLPDQLESAKGNAQTKLPDGIPHPKSWQ